MARIMIWRDEDTGAYHAMDVDTLERGEYPPVDDYILPLGETRITTPPGMWVWDNTRRWMNIGGTWQWVEPTYNLYFAKWVDMDGVYDFLPAGTYEVPDAPYWAGTHPLPDGSLVLAARIRVFAPGSGKPAVLYVPDAARDADYPVAYTGNDLMFMGGRLLH